MDESYGKVFTYIIGIIFVLIVPVMLIAQKMDNVVQSYVDNAAIEFIDKSRVTGYISEDSYLEFMDQLNKTTYIYDVKVVHYTKQAIPIYDDTVFTGDYKVDYVACYDKEIEETLFDKDLDYKMKNGDYIKVTIKNKDRTLGTKLYSFFNKGANINTIYTIYGGYVGNTPE